MMIKDAARFPDGRGQWGYFSFGHKPLPDDSSAVRRPAADCEACDVTLASDTDNVISHAHIALARDAGDHQP